MLPIRYSTEKDLFCITRIALYVLSSEIVNSLEGMGGLKQSAIWCILKCNLVKF